MMRLKKGDLVVRRQSSEEEFYYVPEFSTGILVTDPYVAVFTKQEESGEAIYSFEKIVVDILANNNIIHKCPTEFIVRSHHKNADKIQTAKKRQF